jgi:carbamoyl-phosphate synthase large subunit
MNINRVLLVDTCAAEFKAKTPYYYSTFEAEIEDGTRYVDESIVTDKKKIIVLAQGQIELDKELNLIIHVYTEFFAAKECGYETIMINCNPETVSTDFDTADKLYFEPVFEHIMILFNMKKA